MRENNYKPQMPDVMEAIFDAAYLIVNDFMSCHQTAHTNCHQIA